MTVRNAVMEDLPALREIYRYARQRMKDTGNPNQWGDTSPEERLLLADIEHGNLYIAEKDGVPAGAFALLPGPDPTYSYIEDGAWPDEEPYGVIHRIGRNEKGRGLLAAALEFAGKTYKTLRIDTHRDNRIMRHLLEKYGFTACGIIYLANGDPRIAYHRTQNG